MILGVDLAIATCGWAVVDRDPVHVVDIDLVETAANDGVDGSVSDGLRINRIGEVLAAKVRHHGVTMIAFEQRLSHGAKRAVEAQALCGGLLQGLAVVLDLDLVELVAREWQAEVVPGVADLPKAERYPAVERELGRLARGRLDHLPPAKRNHPLDGMAVALCGALRPNLCRAIRRRRCQPAAAHHERTEGAIA